MATVPVAEVPQPTEPATPAVPDAPVTPAVPDPGTPAAPEEPSTVPGPEEPADPIAPNPGPDEVPEPDPAPRARRALTGHIRTLATRPDVNVDSPTLFGDESTLTARGAASVGF